LRTQDRATPKAGEQQIDTAHIDPYLLKPESPFASLFLSRKTACIPGKGEGFVGVILETTLERLVPCLHRRVLKRTGQLQNLR
jgi:hypothetical protein